MCFTPHFVNHESGMCLKDVLCSRERIPNSRNSRGHQEPLDICVLKVGKEGPPKLFIFCLINCEAGPEAGREESDLEGDIKRDPVTP